VDYLFVSVSGGGLISGVSFYLKYMQHLKIQVIGVQSEGNALFDEKNLIINDLKKEKPFSEMK
jgi:threonine dehydratase